MNKLTVLKCWLRQTTHVRNMRDVQICNNDKTNSLI